jgi:hypothetical protein
MLLVNHLAFGYLTTMEFEVAHNFDDCYDVLSIGQSFVSFSLFSFPRWNDGVIAGWLALGPSTVEAHFEVLWHGCTVTVPYRYLMHQNVLFKNLSFITRLVSACSLRPRARVV